MTANRWRMFAGAAMLAATVLALASMTAPAPAQSLKDSKCTGNPDIPWDEQIAGCTDAITSGKFSEKGLGAAFNNRGNAYAAKSDLDRAISDYDQAIRLDPYYVTAFINRGNVYFVTKDAGRAIADYTEAIRL